MKVDGRSFLILTLGLGEASMNARTGIASLLAVVLVASLWPAVMFACGCAAGPGEPVVNADQTVIMIWEARCLGR